MDHQTLAKIICNKMEGVGLMLLPSYYGSCLKDFK